MAIPYKVTECSHYVFRGLGFQRNEVSTACPYIFDHETGSFALTTPLLWRTEDNLIAQQEIAELARINLWIAACAFLRLQNFFRPFFMRFCL